MRSSRAGARDAVDGAALELQAECCAEPGKQRPGPCVHCGCLQLDAEWCMARARSHIARTLV